MTDHQPASGWPSPLSFSRGPSCSDSRTSYLTRPDGTSKPSRMVPRRQWCHSLSFRFMTTGLDLVDCQPPGAMGKGGGKLARRKEGGFAMPCQQNCHIVPCRSTRLLHSEIRMGLRCCTRLKNDSPHAAACICRLPDLVADYCFRHCALNDKGALSRPVLQTQGIQGPTQLRSAQIFGTWFHGCHMHA